MEYLLDFYYSEKQNNIRIKHGGQPFFVLDEKREVKLYTHCIDSDEEMIPNTYDDLFFLGTFPKKNIQISNINHYIEEIN